LLKSKEADSGPCAAEEKEMVLSNAALLALAQAVLGKGGGFRFKAKGHSMSPFIKEGDVLTLSPPEGGRLGLGVPVGFVNPASGAFVVHRVIGTKGKGYIIKGDSCFGADGLLGKDGIVGYVSSVEREGRRISFGLGWERVAIALLSRLGLLPALLRLWRLLVPYPLRKALLCKK